MKCLYCGGPVDNFPESLVDSVKVACAKCAPIQPRKTRASTIMRTRPTKPLYGDAGWHKGRPTTKARLSRQDQALLDAFLSM